MTQREAPSVVSAPAGVVLVAAGSSSRFGGDVPKQFRMLGGLPVFAHALRAFDGMACISQIVLVLPGEGLPQACEAALNGLTKPFSRVTGGARRQDSTAAGLAALDRSIGVALVHDAARPFPPAGAVERLVHETIAHGGGILAARATDTVKRDDGAGNVMQTLDRATVWLAQTPQAIRADLIPRAIAELRDPACDVTDEAMLLERWGVAVRLVESSPENFKITRSEDFERAVRMLGEHSLGWPPAGTRD